MGVDIRSQAERRVNGKWEIITGPRPIDWRSYSVYGFLADIWNYSAIPPISETRGIPRDSVNRDWWEDCDYFGLSRLSVEERLAYDYDQVIEDRRGAGGSTLPPGQGEP